MKTKSVSLEQWDDVVFENRNKEYGAYSIRKSYSDNLSKALLIGIFSVVIMILLPSLVSSFTTGKVDAKPEIFKDIISCDFSIKPEIILDKQQQIQVARVSNRDLIPVVTTQEVVEELPALVENPTTGIAEGVEGGSLPSDGNLVGTGSPGIAEVAPVINEPVIISIAQKMPEYIGGQSAMLKFLYKHFRYPPIARRAGTTGTVYVSFVIDSNGKVILPKVEKGIDKECDEEALRIISKMPDWIAGSHNNKPAMVRLMLPIKFQMNNL